MIVGGGRDFLPAGGFGGLGLEPGYGFDWVAGRDDLGGVGVEFVSSVFGAGEGAIGFFIEAGGDGFDGAGEELVVLRVAGQNGEPGFDGGELREHGKRSIKDKLRAIKKTQSVS